MRSVKSNKELLLARVTETVEYDGARLGGKRESKGERQMGKTISFVKGKGSIAHNNRDFVANNVDPKRIAWNTNYIQQPLAVAYDQLFGEAITEYNAKQKRKDRRITDYLTDIKNSGNNEKPFYEIVVQIGKMTDTGILDENGNITDGAKMAEHILDQYVKNFQERNPNLYLFNAVLHMDEATPHLHLDYIPVAHGYKTKMHTRNSLTRALQEMGIEKASTNKDNETVHWQQREREYLAELCRDREIEVEIIGVNRDDYSIPEYKAIMKAKEEVEADIEILKAEKMEVESLKDLLDSQVEDNHEKIEESEQQLVEINQQIKEKLKNYEEYEKKVDKVLSAAEPVKKELSDIRKNTKQITSIIGNESSVKLSKKNFEKLMSMAESSGTLNNLNTIYENELGKMQKKIALLNIQVNELKQKVKKHEVFLKLEGMMELFEEYIRPKTIHEKIQKNAQLMKNQKKNMNEIVNNKKQDMVI